MPVIVSPCVRLCAIDHATGLCAGCGRTLDEIGNWMRYDDNQRRLIMAQLPARMHAMERAAREAAPA